MRDYTSHPYFEVVMLCYYCFVFVLFVINTCCARVPVIKVQTKIINEQSKKTTMLI